MSIRIKNKEELRQGVFTLEDIKERKFSTEEFFGNANSVVLDAGCGKGEFLLENAKLHPDLNFIGVDYSWKKCLFSQKKILFHDIKNVMIIRSAFEELFPIFFEDQTFTRIHMNFPDPWPKKRHHRRRSLQMPLVAEFVRMLRPEGDFYFITDSLDYATHAYPIILANEVLIDRLSGIKNELDGYSKTLFCSKAEEQGEAINYIWFSRKG